LCIVFVSRNADRTRIELRPVATEPNVSIDAIWDLYPGQSFYNLTFEELLDASKLEIDDQGVARIVPTEEERRPG